MGKTKLSTMGSNNPTGSNSSDRRLTIANWGKIGVGVDRADTMEAESFYSIRIGSLGAVIVHREIDAKDCVLVEVSNNEGDSSECGKVWIGSQTLENPAELLDRFMNVLTERGWI
jgi:hypothetical protein